MTSPPEPTGNYQRVQALLFDAYGTLFDLDSLTPACEAAFPGRGREFCRLWRAKQIEYTLLLTMMGQYEDFWLVTSKALMFTCTTLKLDCGPPFLEHMLERYFYLQVFPDVTAALPTLSRYPLAILSNGSPKMLQVTVQNAGLEKFFTRIISASEVQAYKPHSQVYHWAAKRLALELEDLGLVSANTWDVMGAKACGLWTCWLNRTGAPWDDLGFTPDVTVSRLTDLPPLLNLPAAG